MVGNYDEISTSPSDNYTWSDQQSHVSSPCFVDQLRQRIVAGGGEFLLKINPDGIPVIFWADNY
jgi:hypothetical protein